MKLERHDSRTALALGLHTRSYIRGIYGIRNVGPYASCTWLTQAVLATFLHTLARIERVILGGSNDFHIKYSNVTAVQGPADHMRSCIFDFANCSEEELEFQGSTKSGSNWNRTIPPPSLYLSFEPPSPPPAMLFEDTSSMGSFMLPGMSSPEQATNSCCRVVRFDNECVLIPKSSLSRSKMPVVLTKSYSLPLWKRKTTQFSDSDPEDPAGSSAQPSSEDNRITIKVPIPTFVLLNFTFVFLFIIIFFSGLEEGLPLPQLGLNL